MSPPPALILGHTFVRRLNSFLSHSISNIYAHNLGLGYYRNWFWGSAGGRSRKLKNSILVFVRTWKPGIVILKLGTNDLATFSPGSVGSSLEELVELLYENCSVKVIGVCQVIKRCPSPPKISFGERCVTSQKIDCEGDYLSFQMFRFSPSIGMHLK